MSELNLLPYKTGYKSEWRTQDVIDLLNDNNGKGLTASPDDEFWLAFKHRGVGRGVGGAEGFYRGVIWFRTEKECLEFIGNYLMYLEFSPLDGKAEEESVHEQIQSIVRRYWGDGTNLGDDVDHLSLVVWINQIILNTGNAAQWFYLEWFDKRDELFNGMDGFPPRVRRIFREGWSLGVEDGDDGTGDGSPLKEDEQEAFLEFLEVTYPEM
jgi:hypothetical protein